MPIISNGETVNDPWVMLDDDAALPAEGDVILSLERLKAEQGAIAGRKGRTGVVLPNAADMADLDALPGSLSLVVLEFPAFTDGRAYSQARQLRTKLGYRGELRASGDVLADQAAFMVGVGFDSFEIAPDQSLDVWTRASRSMSLAYQRGYEGGAATRYRAAANRTSPSNA